MAHRRKKVKKCSRMHGDNKEGICCRKRQFEFLLRTEVVTVWVERLCTLRNNPQIVYRVVDLRLRLFY